MEAILANGVGVHRSPIGACEDVLVRRGVTGAHASVSKEARYSRDEHHVAVGVLCLQRRDLTDPVDLPMDMDDAGSEIDVRPAEPEQLSRAQAR